MSRVTKNSDRRFSLGKKHSLTGRDDIKSLFSKENIAISRFPLTCLFQESDREGVEFLFVVSKRKFKKAVDRNAVKRKLREACRLQKPDWMDLAQPHKGLKIALIYLPSKIEPMQKIARAFKHCLHDFIRGV